MCVTMSETGIDRVNAVLSTVSTRFVIEEAKHFFRDNVTLFQWLPCVPETMHEATKGVKKLTMEKRQTRSYANLCRLLMSSSWLASMRLPVITAQLTESQAYEITKAFDDQLRGRQAVMRALCALTGSSITMTHMPPVDVSAIIMADILSDAVEISGCSQDNTVTDAIQLAVSKALKTAAEARGLFQSGSRPAGGLSATFDTAFSGWHGPWRASRVTSLTEVERRTKSLNNIRDQKLAGKEVDPVQVTELAADGGPFRSVHSPSESLIHALRSRLATMGTAYQGMGTVDLMNISDSETSTPRATLKEGLIWCARADGNRMAKAIVAASTHKDGDEISVTFGNFNNVPDWADLLMAEQGLHGHCSSSSDHANLTFLTEMVDAELCSLGIALRRCKKELFEWDSVDGDLYKKLRAEAEKAKEAVDVIKKSAALLAWLADNLLETFRFAVVAYSREYDLKSDNLLNLPLGDKVSPIDRLMHQARVRTFAADKAILPPLESPDAVPSYSSPAVAPKLTKSLRDRQIGGDSSSAGGSAAVSAAVVGLANVTIDTNVDAGELSASSSADKSSESEQGAVSGPSEPTMPSPAKQMMDTDSDSESAPAVPAVLPTTAVVTPDSAAEPAAGSGEPRRSVRSRKLPPKLRR